MLLTIDFGAATLECQINEGLNNRAGSKFPVYVISEGGS